MLTHDHADSSLLFSRQWRRQRSKGARSV